LEKGWNIGKVWVKFTFLLTTIWDDHADNVLAFKGPGSDPGIIKSGGSTIKFDFQKGFPILSSISRLGHNDKLWVGLEHYDTTESSTSVSYLYILLIKT
jgi:hypothetical protein